MMRGRGRCNHPLMNRPHTPACDAATDREEARLAVDSACTRSCDPCGRTVIRDCVVDYGPDCTAGCDTAACCRCRGLTPEECGYCLEVES